MNLTLKRLFARSMTGGPELVQLGAPPSTRSAVRRATFVTAAGILAIVGVLAAGYYFATRQEVLRIAVGPANSDDVKVVQTLTQAFAQPSLLCPAKAGPDRRRSGERRGAGGEQGRPRGHPRRSRRAPQRAGGRDTAQELRGVVGAAAGQGQRQEGRREDHQDFAACGSQGRRGRQDPGQCEPAEADPAAIWRRSLQGRDRAVSGQRGRGRDPQAVGRRLSRRGSRQQQDHIGCDRGVGQGRRRTDVPRHRCLGGDRDQPSRL